MASSYHNLSLLAEASLTNQRKPAESSPSERCSHARSILVNHHNGKQLEPGIGWCKLCNHIVVTSKAGWSNEMGKQWRLCWSICQCRWVLSVTVCNCSSLSHWQIMHDELLNSSVLYGSRTKGITAKDNIHFGNRANWHSHTDSTKSFKGHSIMLHTRHLLRWHWRRACALDFVRHNAQ